MPRVALVTGAGYGIGRAVTLELANADFAVIAAGRRLDRLHETANLAESGTVIPFEADVPARGEE